jgi:hypothetical protein
MHRVCVRNISVVVTVVQTVKLFMPEIRLKRIRRSLGFIAEVIALVLIVGCGRAPGSAGMAASATRTAAPVSSPATPIPNPSPSGCPTTALPGARANASMAYMPNLNQAVLFGGSSASGPYVGDTWIWQSGCWSATKPTNSPSPRTDMAMAYDPVGKLVLAFGGRLYSGEYSYETWTWDGSSWRLLDSGGPNLVWPLAAFDPKTQRVLLYGADLNGITATFTWDGSKWIAAAGQSPTERRGANMASDPVTGEPLLFGGVSHVAVALLSDTWTWNGTAWIELKPIHSPPARQDAAMATSAALKRTLLVGGLNGPFLSDAWTWDGSDWTPAASPGQRVGGVAVDVGSKVVLFGGSDTTSITNNSATWDGSTWASS